jgi:hypothetical protein
VEGVDGRGGGSSPAPALTSPMRALHDLARLRILRRRPSLWLGSPGVLGSKGVAGGLLTEERFDFDNGSRGRGFSGTGVSLSKSLCRTDLLRLEVFLDC